MPVFDTPEPISVTVDLSVGNVRIAASDRTDTVVEVRPSNESDESDVKAAKQTRVEYSNGTLVVKGPRARVFDLSSKNRSIEVSVDLPTGSQVYLDAAAGDFRCTGQLGECKVKTSTGHVQLEQTGPLRLDTAAGNVTVDRVTGNAEVSTGIGRVRIGEFAGAAVIKNSNGKTEIGTAAGDVRMRAANGDISIDRAAAGVDAKTANGSIRIGEVARGAVVLKTAAGDLEVGISQGTVAWLDVSTGYGHVHNTLDDASPGPELARETVEVRAHTSYGDITVRRSSSTL
jgi:DUF4097 and DUF4098 domain-containing protein YvlB